MTTHDAPPDRRSGAQDRMSVLVIADPGEPAALAERVADHLADTLGRHDRRSRRWTSDVRIEAYIRDEQADLADVMEKIDSSGRDDAIVYLTDLPRRDGTVPVVGEVSPDDRFALISVAGLGAVAIERRVQAVAELVMAHLVDDHELAPRGHARRLRLQKTDTGVRMYAPTGLRRVRLLSGMVRANRPLRLITGLSKVLVGAFATGAIALATSTIWLFADLMGPWRMGAATALSIAAMIVWLIVDHELWERPADRQGRDRAVLYNLATVITLTIGVVTLHVGLFALMLFTAGVTLPSSLFGRTLGHAVGVSDYLTLAWLLASIATIGGALGSGLEDDDAVREAAYGVRQRERIEGSDRRSG